MLQQDSHDPVVRVESARRRTFAIISHPDAGKTTLTEKLLLYAGCFDVAGAVRGRKTQRSATSDWMELERQRGISISSTALSFEYEGHQINLLDTPGHQDFSEDTYRTLTAADCAVMVIDQAKGIEAQTEKLFRVCTMRKIPIITFINKVDRPGRDPFDLLAEVEKMLGIEAVPLNWPVWRDHRFCGIFDRRSGRGEVFQHQGIADRVVCGQSFDLDCAGENLLDAPSKSKLEEDLALLEGAGAPFEQARFLCGEMTPVFFGSALNNYGVRSFLHAFLELSPPPRARMSDRGLVPVDRAEFAGFVFKIQANLDPKHRDRIAFVRVCSGRFAREMEVFHSRTAKKLRIRRSHRLFANERETLDEAYPGDILGLVLPGEFRLGDTICLGQPVNYEPLPRFSPEHFAILECADTLRRKQFERGLRQLVEEGAIQVLRNPVARQREPILAAVGELQFDVVRYRLEAEYDARTSIKWLPYKVARWVVGGHAAIEKAQLPYSSSVVVDQDDQPVILLHSKWDLDYCSRENPDLQFQESSPIQFAIAEPTLPYASAG